MGRLTAASADCYYPANASFEALSYQDKTDYFWGRITESRNRSNYPSAVTVLTTSSQTSTSAIKANMMASNLCSRVERVAHQAERPLTVVPPDRRHCRSAPSRPRS